MGALEALGGSAHQPLLEARDLAVTPPGAAEPAVRGVSLSVAPGEWVALVGGNGGGKTSLLHALAGLWPASAGTLLLDGAPFDPDRRESARSLAAVLQDPSSQILQSTVAEELAFSARNLGFAEDRVAREVERRAHDFGLEGDLGRDPATLSAGRQQQVLLASALVGRPRLLFADEPTAHLDPSARARAREIIRRELEQGLAVVWATQDPDEIRCATRVTELGPAARVSARVGAPAPRPDSTGVPAREPIARVRVAPPGTDSGPRVRVSRPLEIPIEALGVTALVGPNGAGKSVLLASVAGLERPAQVSVAWSGPHEPPILALQYPELQVFEELVADEMVFAAHARGRARSEALADAAHHLGLLGFDPQAMLARRTWTLSTGEKRLVEVIAALIAPSSVTILDEPTAGLDPARREGLARLVLARAGRGPVLVASQDLDWLEGVQSRRFRLGD